MKNASSIMYKIGKIFNIVGIVLTGLCILVGIIIACAAKPIAESAAGNPELLENIEELSGQSIASGVQTVVFALILGWGLGLLIGGIFGLGVEIASLIVLGKQRNKIDEGSLAVAPHVLTIVFGAFTNVFYILSGIFGLIVRAKEKKALENTAE